MYYDYYPSPVGKLFLAGDDTGLKLISFPKGSKKKIPQEGWIKDSRPFRMIKKELEAYFAGRLKQFAVPLVLNGTSFQMLVWKALQKIPYGKTVSYGELAKRVGHPKAARAVGGANHSNPIPIVIPCHRVIGSDGKLTGFGGGLETKKALLDLERKFR